jgi:hypothetical protein
MNEYSPIIDIKSQHKIKKSKARSNMLRNIKFVTKIKSSTALFKTLNTHSSKFPMDIKPKNKSLIPLVLGVGGTASLGFFYHSSQKNALSKEKFEYNHLNFLPSLNDSDVFRGGINEFIEKQSELKNIRSVEVCGEEIKEIGEGAYDSSLDLDSYKLKCFMDIIKEKGVKELAFTGCTLTPKAGAIIGEALKTNITLECLLVTSSQLEEEGMLDLMKGLLENRSLKTFYARSYNVEVFRWPTKLVEMLAILLAVNPVLKEIALPNNRIELSDIAILITPYQVIKNRVLATISGFNHLPNFCPENLDELDKQSRRHSRSLKVYPKLFEEFQCKTDENSSCEKVERKNKEEVENRSASEPRKNFRC